MTKTTVPLAVFVLAAAYAGAQVEAATDGSETVCAGVTKYHRCSCPIVANDRTEIALAEAVRRNLERHEKCAPPEIPAELLQTRPMSSTQFSECADATLPEWGLAKGELLGGAAGGADGSGEHESTILSVVEGRIAESPRGEAVMPIRRGELVRRGMSRGGFVVVSSALKHNVSRGRGMLQHQSAETLNLTLSFVDLKAGECSLLKTAWDQLFAPIDATAVEKTLRANPSGVIVEEIQAGMSEAEVEELLGPPERRAGLGVRRIYFYPRMKVTFTNGKVSDVE